MVVKIEALEWDPKRVEHIAVHQVEPEEVWEVCLDRKHLARRVGKNRYCLYGQTQSGRYLFVVLRKVREGIFKPITAREMTEREKRSYKRRRK